MGATPWQGSIAPESRSLAHADRDERDRLPVEDHLAHAQAELQGPRPHDRTGAGRRPDGGSGLGARRLPAIAS